MNENMENDADWTTFKFATPRFEMMIGAEACVGEVLETVILIAEVSGRLELNSGADVHESEYVAVSCNGSLVLSTNASLVVVIAAPDGVGVHVITICTEFPALKFEIGKPDDTENHAEVNGVVC